MHTRREHQAPRTRTIYRERYREKKKKISALSARLSSALSHQPAAGRRGCVVCVSKCNNAMLEILAGSWPRCDVCALSAPWTSHFCLRIMGAERPPGVLWCPAVLYHPLMDDDHPRPAVLCPPAWGAGASCPRHPMWWVLAPCAGDPPPAATYPRPAVLLWPQHQHQHTLSHFRSRIGSDRSKAACQLLKSTYSLCYNHV